MEWMCCSFVIYRRTCVTIGRGQLKCDGKRAETRFRLSAKRTSPFKSAGASVQSTTGSRGVRISGSNAGYTRFGGSVKSTGYPLRTPVSPSLPLPCVTVCHHISVGVYNSYNILTECREIGLTILCRITIKQLSEMQDNKSPCNWMGGNGVPLLNLNTQLS